MTLEGKYKHTLSEEVFEVYMVKNVMMWRYLESKTKQDVKPFGTKESQIDWLLGCRLIVKV